MDLDQEIPVRQDVAMTGSLSIRGEVLPVGGVTAKIEAAAKAGISTVLIPSANERDVLLEEKYEKMVNIIPVSNIKEVLSHALVSDIRKDSLVDKIKHLFKGSEIAVSRPSTNTAHALEM